MVLIERIGADLKDAQKNQDVICLSVLRLISATVKNRELEKRAKIFKGGGQINLTDDSFRLTEEEVIGVILSEIKKRRESMEQYQKAGRNDLFSKEQGELDILLKYIPEQLSEEKLKEMVSDAVKEAGAQGIKDLGAVMTVLMPKVKGRAEGNAVSRLVREALGA